jgi:hypothetical protein
MCQQVVQQSLCQFAAGQGPCVVWFSALYLLLDFVLTILKKVLKMVSFGSYMHHIEVTCSLYIEVLMMNSA